MKNSLKLTALILIFSFASFSLCACDQNSVGLNDIEKVVMHASWCYNYEDVEELSSDSDLVALVSVKEMNSSHNGSYAETVYRADVEDLIYGEERKSISIVMTGGIIDGVVYEIVDDPLMQKGDKFLIFAKENEDGTFTILSGPQGRFVVNDGSVYSLNEANEQVAEANVYSNISVRGTDYDAFVQQVKSYVTE